MRVYVHSLKTIWWVGLAVGLLGFFMVGAERDLELRKDLETEYGIDEDKKTGARNSGEHPGPGVLEMSYFTFCWYGSQEMSHLPKIVVACLSVSWWWW